ncbi:glycosyltransferase [Nitratifractor sp.]|uniref:glycosyltransferase n=1 Tax=Nitratifractor sp. TaxID=2268144 RepID=UPI0025D85DAF|nr:glycosyltransferase [Nitratifractor sp.]
MIRLVLAIRSLDIGGAERQFIELVKGIDKTKFEVTVCTMYGGVQESIVREIPGITYYNLGKKGRYDIFGFYRKYRGLLNEIRPDVIYSFMGEMNLFSLWCKSKQTRLIWGFRASDMDLSKYGKMAQLLFWLQKKSSCRVDGIIANSRSSVAFHETNGFCMERAVVIPNGIDIERFRRDMGKREAFRKRYDLRENDIAIGIVARLDPMKGYPVLARAAKALLERYENVKFFAAGDGDPSIKNECETILGEINGSRFVWLGRRENMEEIYNGLDIAISASLFGEGFSNSVAEAMSCGIPCVVTDVGDSAFIVGDTGFVVPSNDVAALYEGLEQMLRRDLDQFGKWARARIETNFSTVKMVQETERKIYEVIE